MDTKDGQYHRVARFVTDDPRLAWHAATQDADDRAQQAAIGQVGGLRSTRAAEAVAPAPPIWRPSGYWLIVTRHCFVLNAVPSRVEIFLGKTGRLGLDVAFMVPRV